MMAHIGPAPQQREVPTYLLHVLSRPPELTDRGVPHVMHALGYYVVVSCPGRCAQLVSLMYSILCNITKSTLPTARREGDARARPRGHRLLWVPSTDYRTRYTVARRTADILSHTAVERLVSCVSVALLPSVPSVPSWPWWWGAAAAHPGAHVYLQ